MTITPTTSGRVGTIRLTFLDGKSKEITPGSLAVDAAAACELLRRYVEERVKASKSATDPAATNLPDVCKCLECGKVLDLNVAMGLGVYCETCGAKICPE